MGNRGERGRRKAGALEKELEAWFGGWFVHNGLGGEGKGGGQQRCGPRMADPGLAKIHS